MTTLKAKLVCQILSLVHRKRMTLPQNERTIKLNQIAISQLKSLTQNTTLKNLK